MWACGLAGAACERASFIAPMAFDFRALRYFVAVAEELHFTRAAERMYIAQPALSEQIRRLERDLGVELLRRTTRKVELTAAGEEFLSRARRILAEADEALAAASRAARGETGSVRVATGATAGLEQVPAVLRAFREARPLVHLDIRQIDWEDYSGGLRDGSVDAAFVWRPFEDGGLSFAALHVEPRVVALEAGHRLASVRELRMEQVVDEPWPWVDTDPVALAFWTCADYRGGAAARRGPTIRSMEGMLEGGAHRVVRRHRPAIAGTGLGHAGDRLPAGRRPHAGDARPRLARGRRDARGAGARRDRSPGRRRERKRRFIGSARLIAASPSFSSGGGRGSVRRMDRNETVIRVGDEPVTFINVFDVDASKQQELVGLLTEGTEKVMQHRPGFVSVNILASNDGTRVVNYAQWRSYDDVKATMADPEAQDYARRAAELAQASPHVYSVVFVHHA